MPELDVSVSPGGCWRPCGRVAERRSESNPSSSSAWLQKLCLSVCSCAGLSEGIVCSVTRTLIEEIACLVGAVPFTLGHAHFHLCFCS